MMPIDVEKVPIHPPAGATAGSQREAVDTIRIIVTQAMGTRVPSSQEVILVPMGSTSYPETITFIPSDHSPHWLWPGMATKRRQFIKSRRSYLCDLRLPGPKDSVHA